MVVTDLVSDVQTGHEVAHVLDHVAILVDFDRVQVKFDSTVRGTLFSGEE